MSQTDSSLEQLADFSSRTLLPTMMAAFRRHLAERTSI